MSTPLATRILAFIPAYRCEAQIGRVIQQFDPDVQRLIDTVLIVDNQSPDDTLKAGIDAGRRILRQSNFIAWRNDDNYGLGGSHKAAFRYAVEQGFDYLIVLHGDDQGDIHDLVPLIKAGVHESVDCLMGSRFTKGSRLKGYSRLRTFGNRVYNLLFSAVALQSISDLGSGLNLYRLAAFREFYYKTFPDDLTFNYVMLLGSYHRQQRVKFFPISWREDDQVSNVKLFRQASRVLGLLAKYGIKRGKFLESEMRLKPFDTYQGEIVYRQEGAR